MSADEANRLDEVTAVAKIHHPSAGEILLAGESQDEYVFSLIAASGLFYEADLLDLLDHLGVWTGCAVDVGAHIGNHAVFFAGVLGMRTYAIEPRTESFNLLNENLRRNGLDDLVTSFQIAVGAETGFGSLQQSANSNSGAFKLIADPRGVVTVRRLDDVISDEVDVSLLKLDVEGMEAEVLVGGSSLLERCRPVMTVECHSGASLRRILGLIEPLGYEEIAIAGRSDNYLFVSNSPASPIDVVSARRRAAVYGDRLRLRVAEEWTQKLRVQLRSLGEQIGAIDRNSTQALRASEEIRGQLEVLITSARSEQVDRIERSDAEAARWKQEYTRLRRSRALRLASALRAFATKIGISSRPPSPTVDDIERDLESRWK